MDDVKVARSSSQIHLIVGTETAHLPVVVSQHNQGGGANNDNRSEDLF